MRPVALAAYRSGNAVRALPAGVCAGVLVGALILAVAGSSLKWILIMAAAGCLPALLLVAGSMTRVLQALLIFSLSMSLDVYPGFSEKFADTRPGVPVGLTAVVLLCLFGLGLPGVSTLKASVRTRAVTIPFALLVVWAVLSLSVASRPSYVVQSLPGYIASFLLYLYALRLMRSPGDVRFTCTWVALAVFVSGVLALAQYGLGDIPGLAVLGGGDTQIVQNYQREQISRVSGLLRHPNTFAVFLNGFLPLLLVLAFTIEERWLRLLSAAACGLGTLALVLTYSRGGWLSFAVSVALILVAIPKRHWRPGFGAALLLVTSLAVLAVMLVATPLYSRVVTRLAEDDQGAAQSRVTLVRASLEMIREHPITGVGLGNYQFASPIVTDDRGVPLIEPGDGLSMRVHNLFLFTAVEIGIPATLLLGAIIVLFFLRGIAVVRRGAWLPSRVALGLTCGLAAILTHCMLEPATLADPSYLVLSFVGGCMTGLEGRMGADE